MFSFDIGHRFTSIVALALLGLAWAAPAAQAVDTKFQASSTFEIVAHQGTHNTLAGKGRSAPGGAFTITALIHQVGNGDGRGVITFDFGKGDTLTYYHEVEWFPETGRAIGPYVITDGTGRFAGASGSGIQTVDPAGDGTGVFWLEGTISY